MATNDDGGYAWLLEKDGMYSVKSAYAKLKEIKDAERASITGECSDKREIKRFWRGVWRLRAQSKIKVFVWRLFHDALPTAINLKKRGIDADMPCKSCGFKVESNEHTFISCWWARAFWAKLGMGSCWDAYGFGNVQEWLWFCFKNYASEVFALICYGAFMIWRNRNLMQINKTGLDIIQSSAWTRSRVYLFNSANFKFSVIGQEEARSWVAPEGRMLKINCDGAWCESLEKAGVGCVVRDSDGVVREVLAEWINGISSSTDAEGLAVLLAINWAAKEMVSDCVFETDCAEVFSMIHKFNGQSANSRSWVAKCALALVEADGWKLSLIYREANGVADMLARKAMFESWSWNWPAAIPRSIGKLL